jgi:tripartite-type tricarboxylate transporter receptor subunit TctC
MGRPFAAPPGIPAERKAALLKAFNDAMQDADLLAEATKEKIEINPMTGEAIDMLLDELYATPADVVSKAAKAVSE